MKTRRNKWSVRVLAVLMVLSALCLLCACKDDVTDLSLDTDSLTMTVGESVTLKAIIAPADAADVALVWTSSDEAIISVKDGAVTAVAVGKATVTVSTKDGAFTKSASVEVKPKETFTRTAAKAATCTENGNIEYWTSDLTGKYYSDAEGKHEITEIVVAATGHVASSEVVCGEAQNCVVCSAVISESADHAFGEWVVVNTPTETEAGVAERVCARDDDHKETMELPALSEANGYTYKVTTEPTDETAGEGVYTYTQNGVSFTFKVEIAPKVHVYDKGVVKVEATCEEDGIKVFTCLDCGATYEQTIRATGHRYGTAKVTVEATCTEAGKKVSTCRNCKAKKTQTIRPLGHDFADWTFITTPTLDAKGEIKRVCTRDSSHVETFVLPALNPTDYVYTIVTAPACESKGEGKYTYTKNDTVLSVTVELAEIGHAYKWTLTTAPTESATGMLTNICQNDAEHTDGTFELPVLEEGENYRLETTAPKCGVEGNKKYTFINTDKGNFAFDVKIDALEHEFGVWTETTKPTTTTEGLLTRKCSHATVDACTETLTIPALTEKNAEENDALSCMVTIPAKCEAKGEATFIFTVTEGTPSSYEYTVELPELGHEIGEWVQTKDPTADDVGTLTGTCTRGDLCNDKVKTITCDIPELKIEKYNGSYVDYTGSYVVDKQVDCENDGEITFTFKKDGQSFDNKLTVTKLGHKYEYAADDATKSYWTWTVSDDQKSATATLTFVCQNECTNTKVLTVEGGAVVIAESEKSKADCENAGEIEWTATATDADITGSPFTATKTTNPSALGHKWGDWRENTKPTADADGVLKRVCAHNDEHEDTFAIPKLTQANYSENKDGYTVSFDAGTAVCEQATTQTFTFIKLADDYSAEFKGEYQIVGAKLEHNYPAWKLTTPPTATADGQITSVCERCEEPVTVDVPALNTDNYNGENYKHTALCGAKETWEFTFKKAADATVNHAFEQTFTIEGDVLTHSYGAWTLTTAPTFEQTGTLTRACNRVGCPNPTDTFTLPVLNKNDYALNEGDAKDVYTYTKDGQSFVFEGYEVTFVHKDANGNETQTVKSVSRVQGDSAAVTVTAPDLSTPTSAGDVFDKWDVAFDDVTAHMTVTAVYKLSVLAENVAVALGADTVEVAISLRNAPKLSSLTFSVQYDNALLTLIGHEFKFTPVIYAPDPPEIPYNTVGKQTISVVNPMTDMQMHDENGEMIVLTFEISDSVTEARDIDISLVWEENSNAIVSNGGARVDVDVELLSGKISVQ